MATASAFIDLPVSAEQIWELIGGFNALPDWVSLIATSEAGEGGRLRTLTTQDGTVIVERLQTFNNAQKTYSYSIVESPFPVTDYLATLSVVAQGEGARVTWSGHFTPAGITEEAAQELFNSVYQGGLESLGNTVK